MLLPESITQEFVLSLESFDKQEYWQLLSGHFMHTNLWHFTLNIAGLYLTYFLFAEYYSLKNIALALSFSTVGLSIMLMLSGSLDNIAWYAGLSGTLHGLFAYALVLDLHKKRISTYILIIFGIGKLVFEQSGGSTQSTAELIGASVAINGHLWGAVLGTIAGCIAKFKRIS